ncbi:fasciclin-like arabinogalactan protein 12 [Cannabis sativa]|uniref:fasciclin-like arabinogalactan protein 12 n=1 Tax=Cannabis sativa TaxID=3483 RepID=UPI0029CA8F13|nr:fasciclin-like arabinogalactan protein 12 [Cannabis sativa]
MNTKHFVTIFSFLTLIFFHATTLATTPTAHAPSQSPAQAPAKPLLAQPPKKSKSSSGAPALDSAASSAPPLSQEPIVQAPPHKGRSRIPTDVAGILEKVGGFSVFNRLLKSTEVLTQIENQLSASNSLTILAPTNDAFASSLKPGTLNTLTKEQKIQMIQYHVLPTFISLSNFQTLSNPVRTQAANTYDYPMNITTEGNWVNISTGIVNASITATVFSDDQLAIYRVDKVLLPLGVFAPRPKLQPSPSPSALLAKPTKDSSSNSSSSSSSSSMSSRADGPGGASEDNDDDQKTNNASSASDFTIGARTMSFGAVIVSMVATKYILVLF